VIQTSPSRVAATLFTTITPHVRRTRLLGTCRGCVGERRYLVLEYTTLWLIIPRSQLSLDRNPCTSAPLSHPPTTANNCQTPPINRWRPVLVLDVECWSTNVPKVCQVRTFKKSLRAQHWTKRTLLQTRISVYIPSQILYAVVWCQFVIWSLGPYRRTTAMQLR
jgi:hypothetical protein